MKISPITKQQWKSVIKNAVIAGVVAFAGSVSVTGNVDKGSLIAALSVAGAAVVKTIEKAFTKG